MRQTELAQGRGEPKAVDEPEDEAHHPAPRDNRPHEDVLGRDEGDGQGNDCFDQPVRQRHDVEHGEREGHAVGDGEGGDDLDEREPASAAQEQPQEEQQVVPAGQDVLDAEPHEAPDATRAARVAQLDPGLARIGGERELGGLARRIDPGQRVVVGAEHVEEVVADPQVTDLGRARVVTTAVTLSTDGGASDDRSGPGLAAPPVERSASPCPG